MAQIKTYNRYLLVPNLQVIRIYYVEYNFLLAAYSSPTYIKDATNEAIFDFSMTCLQNSKNILKALEEEYEELFERKLTLSSLNEVLVYPRIIDYGNNLSYSKNNTPSSYLEDDIEKLNRLKKIILR